MSNPFSGNGGGQHDRIPVRQVCTVLYDQLPTLDARTTEARLRQFVREQAKNPTLIILDGLDQAMRRLQR